MSEYLEESDKYYVAGTSGKFIGVKIISQEKEETKAKKKYAKIKIDEDHYTSRNAHSKVIGHVEEREK